jgi:hypothetical protein
MTEPEAQPSGRERSPFPVTFAVGAVVVALLAAGLMLAIRWTQPRGPAAAPHLPFGAEERAYAAQIQIQNIEMSHATNFLNQEFIYVDATISNHGARTLAGVEVSLEFHDQLNQVILRETQRVVGAATRPLGAGESRAFEVTLEHIPSAWNWQYPTARVTGLLFR